MCAGLCAVVVEDSDGIPFHEARVWGMCIGGGSRLKGVFKGGFCGGFWRLDRRLGSKHRRVPGSGWAVGG